MGIIRTLAAVRSHDMGVILAGIVAGIGGGYVGTAFSSAIALVEVVPQPHPQEKG